MEIYKVGGYVRDKLLGLTPADCDYVVVGATREEMLAQGYIQVGKYFPVFLHPKTREEYALARSEVKNGQRHQDFTINASPEISLEEDLSRRDLTINAIAEDKNGSLIDPYGGIKDLKLKTLRHISKAFKDDPLRILRVARFAATLGFEVASETMLLLKEMAAEKSGHHISRERIVREFEIAFDAKFTSNFFYTLSNSNNLEIFFPNLFLSPTSDSLKKLAFFLDNAENSAQKYTALSILIARDPKLIKLVSLNKRQIAYIRNSKDIYDNLEINMNSQDILALLKKTNSLRDLEVFENIITNLQWFVQISNAPAWQKLELRILLRSAKALQYIPKQLIAEKIANHDIIERIHKWQLETISVIIHTV